MARKYGHPLAGTTTLDQSRFENSEKSGLSPLPTNGTLIRGFGGWILVDEDVRDSTMEYQRDRFLGFTIDELVAMEVRRLWF